MTNLEALLERVRAATRGSLDLDVEIVKAVYPESGEPTSEDFETKIFYHGPYTKTRLFKFTSSLDAIAGLIERKLPGWAWEVSSADKEYNRDPMATLLPLPIGDGCKSFYAVGKTPPLALCIAFLEALIVQEKEEEKLK